MTSALHSAEVPRNHHGHHRPSTMVVLVDARHVASAQSRGLPPVAIPDEGVDSQWVWRLAGRFATVVMDAHPADRARVQRFAADLGRAGAIVAVADFAPHRVDGYRLSDWLKDHPRLSDSALLHLVAPSSAALTGLVAAA